MDASSYNVTFLKKDYTFLHSHPEIGWHEFLTSQYIQTQLGKPYWQKKTALIYRIGTGPSVLFRTEIDALSSPSGIKHLCGHSAHTAVLMSVFRHFKKYPPKNYSILFVFQPCEEGYPSGAQFVSTNFHAMSKVLAAIALHLYPSPKKGEIINSRLAAGDFFQIAITGKSTHIKNKYLNSTHDCLFPLSFLLTHINRTRWRHALVNVGTGSFGEAPNSIAGKALIQGDVRALHEQDRKNAEMWLNSIRNLAKNKFPLFSFTLNYFRGFPLLTNDPTLLYNFSTLLPVDRNDSTFGTEDFSLYPVPHLFLHIGTGSTAELHSNHFIVPNDMLPLLLKIWITIGENIPCLLRRQQ